MVGVFVPLLSSTPRAIIAPISGYTLNELLFGGDEDVSKDIGRRTAILP